MARTVNFFQVIYKEEQRGSCYPFAKVYFNETLTDSFENDIICRLVPNSNADYVGVASWRLRQKRNDGGTPQVLGHKLELTEEKIVNEDFDVAVLTPRRPNFRPLDMAANWHGQAWQQAFGVFKTGFLDPMGIRLPNLEAGEDLIHTIHENHFIAQREIYKAYVREVLKPAIEFCESNTVFKMDSGYVHKKRDLKEVKEYQQKSGRLDWPIQPFILERLFSIWIDDKNFKVVNL